MNGERHYTNMRNFTRDGVSRWLTFFRTRVGLQTIRFRKIHHTSIPSIQGVWHPFLNKDPELNITTFPCVRIFKWFVSLIIFGCNSLIDTAVCNCRFAGQIVSACSYARVRYWTFTCDVRKTENQWTNWREFRRSCENWCPAIRWACVTWYQWWVRSREKLSQVAVKITCWKLISGQYPYHDIDDFNFAVTRWYSLIRTSYVP